MNMNMNMKILLVDTLHAYRGERTKYDEEREGRKRKGVEMTTGHCPR